MVLDPVGARFCLRHTAVIKYNSGTVGGGQQKGAVTSAVIYWTAWQLQHTFFCFVLLKTFNSQFKKKKQNSLELLFGMSELPTSLFLWFGTMMKSSMATWIRTMATMAYRKSTCLLTDWQEASFTVWGHRARVRFLSRVERNRTQISSCYLVWPTLKFGELSLEFSIWYFS